VATHVPQFDQWFITYDHSKLSVLLEIPVEPKEGSLLTLDFDLRRTETKGNDEYQGHRGFHTLSKEGGNSEF
jgi:hypothetical protein